MSHILFANSQKKEKTGKAVVAYVCVRERERDKTVSRRETEKTKDCMYTISVFDCVCTVDTVTLLRLASVVKETKAPRKSINYSL